MKARHLILIGLTLGLASCVGTYQTAPVAAHAGAGYIVGVGPTAMAMAPTTTRQMAEAQKSQAFYK
jgi:hypothetical protein